MPDTDTVTREDFEELRDSIRDLRRLFITGNGSPGNSAPAGPAADAAQLLAIEDLTDKVATLNREVANLPATLCDELEGRFVVDEEDEDGPAVKTSAKAKAKSKASATDDGFEEAPRARRSYFPDA